MLWDLFRAAQPSRDMIAAKAGRIDRNASISTVRLE